MHRKVHRKVHRIDQRIWIVLSITIKLLDYEGRAMKKNKMGLMGMFAALLAVDVSAKEEGGQNIVDNTLEVIYWRKCI